MSGWEKLIFPKSATFCIKPNFRLLERPLRQILTSMIATARALTGTRVPKGAKKFFPKISSRVDPANAAVPPGPTPQIRYSPRHMTSTYDSNSYLRNSPTQPPSLPSSLSKPKRLPRPFLTQSVLFLSYSGNAPRA